MLPGSANLSPIKGPPSGCIALLPQLSALFCLCLKFLLSKMFTARQVSLKAPTFVWGRFFPFQFLFRLCPGNLSPFGLACANALWSFFLLPLVCVSLHSLGRGQWVLLVLVLLQFLRWMRDWRVIWVSLRAK